MLKISPKVIDVESNRIGYDMSDTNVSSNPLYRFKNKDRYRQVTDNGQKKGITTNFVNSLKPPNENGRFPTQLFTNIKKDIYKYIKIIK